MADMFATLHAVRISRWFILLITGYPIQHSINVSLEYFDYNLQSFVCV